MLGTDFVLSSSSEMNGPMDGSLAAARTRRVLLVLVAFPFDLFSRLISCRSNNNILRKYLLNRQQHAHYNAKRLANKRVDRQTSGEENRKTFIKYPRKPQEVDILIDPRWNRLFLIISCEKGCFHPLGN